MTALLRARGTYVRCARVPEHGLLLDRSPIRKNGGLTRELGVERSGDERERIEVLDLGLGTELRVAATARADVGVDAKTSLLHAQVAHVHVLEDLLERREIRRRLGGRSPFRFAHDLDERNAGPIEVHRGYTDVAVMNGLARVLLHVQTRDADAAI